MDTDSRLKLYVCAKGFVLNSNYFLACASTEDWNKTFFHEVNSILKCAVKYCIETIKSKQNLECLFHINVWRMRRLFKKRRIKNRFNQRRDQVRLPS